MKNTLDILKYMKHAANHYNVIGYKSFYDSPKVKNNTIMDDHVISMVINDFYVNSFFNNAQMMADFDDKKSKKIIKKPIIEMLFIIGSIGLYFILSLLFITVLKVYITPNLNLLLLSLPFIFSFNPLFMSIYKKVKKIHNNKLASEKNLVLSIQKTTQNLNADLDMIRLLIAGGNEEYAFIEEEINYLDSYINDSSGFLKKIQSQMFEEINNSTRFKHIDIYDKKNISFKKILKEEI